MSSLVCITLFQYQSPVVFVLTTGQGPVILLLALTSVLWTLGGCQLDSNSADNPSSSQSVLKEFSTPPLQTSFTADSLLSSETATELSPTVSYYSATDGDSVGSSAGKLSELWESSTFVSPIVTFYPTPTYSEHLASPLLLVSDPQISSSFSAVPETLGDSELTPVTSRNPSLGLVIESTTFLDSVAASLRWNPAEEGSESTWPVSHAQAATPPSSGAGAPSAGTRAPDELSSSSALVLVAPTTTSWLLVSGTLTPNITEGLGFQSEDPLEASTSSVSLPVFPSVSQMFNSTQSQTPNVHPQAAETTSPMWSTPLGVSSPGPAGGNTSCAETDTGCVEYRGEDDDEEERARIKIIVGVACGAILLVVVLGKLGFLTKKSKTEMTATASASVYEN